MSISFISMTSKHFDVRKYSYGFQSPGDSNLSRNTSRSITKVAQGIAKEVLSCGCCFTAGSTLSSPLSQGTEDTGGIMLYCQLQSTLQVFARSSALCCKWHGAYWKTWSSGHQKEQHGTLVILARRMWLIHQNWCLEVMHSSNKTDQHFLTCPWISVSLIEIVRIDSWQIFHLCYMWRVFVYSCITDREVLKKLSAAQANNINNGSFVCQNTVDFSRVPVKLIQELGLDF